MSLFSKKSGKKQVVLANNNVSNWEKFDGKTILEVDAMTSLIDVHIGTNTIDGKEISNIVLEFKDKQVAFPLSRGLAEDPSIMLDEEQLIDCQFFIRNKFDEMKDKEGVYPYSGPKYISFGKPASITFDSLESLVKEKVETK